MTKVEIQKSVSIPLRLLHIETSKEFTLTFVQKLRENGYEVSYQSIQTLEELDQALSQNTWDIVISDFQLPHFNAVEAILLFKTKELDIPFIILTDVIGEEAARLIQEEHLSHLHWGPDR